MLSRFGMSFAINISQVEEIKLKFFSQMISMTRMYHKTLSHRMNFMRRNLSLTTIQREVEWTCLHMVLSE
uniref:Bm731 n=1 Tax=Brugia malayi TaxID=6279 RepID=A0A0J9Y487_BRUMA|nr:Bm731 [Brugia malayi]